MGVQQLLMRQHNLNHLISDMKVFMKSNFLSREWIRREVSKKSDTNLLHRILSPAWPCWSAPHLGAAGWPLPVFRPLWGFRWLRGGGLQPAEGHTYKKDLLLALYTVLVLWSSSITNPLTDWAEPRVCMNYGSLLARYEIFSGSGFMKKPSQILYILQTSWLNASTEGDKYNFCFPVWATS